MKSSLQTGFSLVELMVSMLLTLMVSAAVLALVTGAQRGVLVQPEVADMNQRLRAAVEMLAGDLMAAGAGLDGLDLGPLSQWLPPVRPARTGLIDADDEMTAFTDRITILVVPPGASEGIVAQDLASPSSEVWLQLRPEECATEPCGFAAGTRALILDTSAAGAGFDLFTLTGSSVGVIWHEPPNPPFSFSYRADVSRVVQVEQHVYYHDHARNRLMHYDGYRSDLPLVDDVVDLRFSYLVDPDPSSAPRPPAGQGNCVFAAGSPAVPLLQGLGGQTPVELEPRRMTDGPWCGETPNRFDGDLLRLRAVRVVLRVRATAAAVQGLGSVALTPETPLDGALAEYGLSFEVTPRNLNLSR